MDYFLFLMQDLAYKVLAIGAFILPLCMIYKKKYQKLDWIILWILPLVFDQVYVIGVVIFGGLGMPVVSSIEILSIFTLVSTIIWNVVRKKGLKDQIGLYLLIHVEGIIFSLGFSKILLVATKPSHMTSYIVLLFLLLFQIGLAAHNGRFIQLVRREKRSILFFLFLLIVISGVYFYQIIYLHFFSGQAVRIIVEGSQTELNSVRLSSSVKLFFGFLGAVMVLAVIVGRYLWLSASYKEKKAREQELQNYIEIMEVMQTDIRKIHHDYKNLITALGGYLYEEEDGVDIPGLKAYYLENVLIQKETELKTINLSKLQKIKILELKGLLAAKLIKASQQSIQVSLEMEDSIEQLPMDKLDLTRMLGILLDNAIEATAPCKDPEIRVAFIKNKGITLLIIENTTENKHISLTDLNRSGFSTKGSGRGLGLHTLSEIIDKYDQVYQETTVMEGNFQQRITFQDANFEGKEVRFL